MNKKGALYYWLLGIVMLITVTIVYIIGARIIDEFDSVFHNIGFNNTEYYNQTFTTLKTTWIYWPLVIVIGLIVFWIVVAQRREPEMYYP